MTTLIGQDVQLAGAPGRGVAAGGGKSSDPSFIHLSFRGGAPRLVQPLAHDIIVIDDFWHDPEALRDRALQGPFVRRLSASGFAFCDWPADRRHTARLAGLVARVAGAALLGGHYESRFVYETAADEVETRRKVWVHYDRWVRVGVLYLSDPATARGGTGFYRHRGTGFTTVSEADAAGRRAEVMEDSTDPRRWELICQVPIRFNRMVLFSSEIFHQALCYFGSTAGDARLYNIVAFDPPSRA